MKKKKPEHLFAHLPILAKNASITPRDGRKKRFFFMKWRAPSGKHSHCCFFSLNVMMC
jgi:hypothetical protein